MKGKGKSRGRENLLKRLFATMLALVLTVADVGVLWPAIQARAAKISYDIWIGSTQVTSDNMNDLSSAVTGTNATASYDPETHVLNFQNVTGVNGTYNLTGALITIAEDVTITGDLSLASDEAYYGIVSWASMSDGVPAKVTMNGNLNIKAKYSAISISDLYH